MSDYLGKAYLEALSSLARQVGGGYVVADDVVTWFHETLPCPTEDEINAEVARLQAEQEATQYKRDRLEEYPSIDELVVAIWEGVVEERMASVTALEGIRQAVKTKYPKG